ncbi:MAG: membrane protein insertase YidC [Alphaproteobacteria bacterium]|nr:membrane protein insertase YidC [Alphaproteobacteria bacterium]
MSDQRNLAIAVVMSVLIIFTFDKFFSPPSQSVTPKTIENMQEIAVATPYTDKGTVPLIPQEEFIVAENKKPTTSVIKSEHQRIKIKTDSIQGSIMLKGARIDDITLVKYKQEQKPDSENIAILSPVGSSNPYYMEFGWIPSQKNQISVPDKNTIWTADKELLTTDSPLTLTWNNGQGLRFIRTYSIDENYMFSITQEVENTTDNTIALFPYGLISRIGQPEEPSRGILHEGPIGVFNGKLEEASYDEIEEDKSIKFTTNGGWIGITDKYWLTALVFDQKAPEVTARFNYREAGSANRYQTDYLAPAVSVVAGGKTKVKNHFFVGAKEISLLDEYSEKLGIDRFDLAIDFGWYYFLTKPFFYILKYLHSHLGNFGLAILAGTILLRLLMYPLASKSFKNMGKMKKIQPKVKKLQERFGDDKVRLNQEMLSLYKNEKVNPAAGCLPMFIQIPVFFSLYKVLYISIEMRHAPFYGWITDLSAPDPIPVFNLFGLLPFTPPSFLNLGVWPIIMGITMFLQQKLNPKPADETQAKVMMFLPVIFMFMLGSFPAGLVIYWAFSNCLSIIQQRYIMYRMGVEP